MPLAKRVDGTCMRPNKQAPFPTRTLSCQPLITCWLAKQRVAESEVLRDCFDGLVAPVLEYIRWLDGCASGGRRSLESLRAKQQAGC